MLFVRRQIACADNQ